MHAGLRRHVASSSWALAGSRGCAGRGRRLTVGAEEGSARFSQPEGENVGEEEEKKTGGRDFWRAERESMEERLDPAAFGSVAKTWWSHYPGGFWVKGAK